MHSPFKKRLFSSAGSQALACAVIVWIACLLVASGHLYSPDEEILFRLTESIARRGEFHIEPLGGFATRAGRGGHQYPQYPPLQPLLATPLYGLARLTRPLVSDAAILSRVWPTIQNHDGSADAVWNRLWVALGFNSLVTAATAALVWLMALRLAGGDRRAAWITALAYALATHALPHSKTFFTEPLAALWLMAALAALLRWHDDEQSAGDGKARWPLLAGLACAAGVWTRVDFPLFLPGISIGAGLLAFPGLIARKGICPLRLRRARGWTHLALFLAPVLAALAGKMLFDAWCFGGAGETGYADQPEGVQFATPFFIGLHGFLCSPGKGIFFFSPPLALALFGFGRLGRERPVFAWAAGLACGVFFVLMCKWQNWPGGWCWGPRHIAQLHAPLVLGLAPLLRPPRKPWIRMAVPVMLAAGLAVQIFGSSQSFIDYYYIFFRTPAEQPNLYALYSPEEEMWLMQTHRFEALTAGGPVPFGARMLPAPINDSIYVPQNTQWFAYPAMLLNLKMNDFLWVHLLQTRAETQPSHAPGRQRP